MTQALVRVASPNPPGDTSAVAEVAEGLLAAIPGIEIQRVEPEPGIVSLVARVRARRPGRRLIFNGHLDTFPVGERPAGACRRSPGCCARAASTVAAYPT